MTSGLLSPKMLRGHAWQRLLPDVYAHRDLPVDHQVWCSAVSLILPRHAAIGGPSAAHLWGAGLVRSEPPVSVVTSRDKWMHKHPRLRIHHTTLAPGDLTELGGIAVTTPERTAFDLGRRLSRTDGVVLIDAMIHAGRLDANAVIDLARQRAWWPRIGHLRNVMSLTDGRAESPMETRLRLLLHDGGVPRPEPQFEVRDDRGLLVARVDLGWPAARLAVEYEGDHHRDQSQFRRDITRTHNLQRHGWTVMRFGADDVLRCPHDTVLAVATELARRR
ncbi:hypothetical protein GCM10010168_50820 [Actinoplanes ianthinogenes]|uniref:DUF559 domain-containing protein n=1 Tax=Actinoplanes ianthinogenes TaxID=122358 RepID=A0ABM7M3A4_9ACTN|nr:hypothetical protein Aiant_67900 [Actinoplanes ianthinogenes]GGR26484.1 hypothetical protein GCM10010168_50820 [Actinoplanes ianthinogenes]